MHLGDLEAPHAQARRQVTARVDGVVREDEEGGAGLPEPLHEPVGARDDLLLAHEHAVHVHQPRPDLPAPHPLSPRDPLLGVARPQRRRHVADELDRVAAQVEAQPHRRAIVGAAALGRQDLQVELLDAAGDLRPRVALHRDGAAPLAPVAAPIRVVELLGDAGREGPGVAGRDEAARRPVADDLAEADVVGADDRRARGHRLEQDHAEGGEDAGRGEDRRLAVEARALLSSRPSHRIRSQTPGSWPGGGTWDATGRRRPPARRSPAPRPGGSARPGGGCRACCACRSGPRRGCAAGPAAAPRPARAAGTAPCRPRSG